MMNQPFLFSIYQSDLKKMQVSGFWVYFITAP